MRSGRQLILGMFMALLSGALVFGSISLSLFESGYAIGQASTPIYTPIVFSGQQIINLAGILGLETQVPPTQTQLEIQTPTAPGCVYPEGWQPVTVKPDDTLRLLAEQYAVPAETIQSANCMITTSLAPGSFLYLPLAPTQPPRLPPPTIAVCRPPAGWVTYFVRPGDTLYRIAASVGGSAGWLQSANCLTSSYIYSGQMLYVPYYPAVSYPTATRWWPTATYFPQPTNTPRIITAEPTSTSVPTAEVTPTPEPTSMPTSTLPPVPTQTELPPTATEPPPPSDTPLPPPPTATEVPPPTLPPPPSDTPVPPPTQPPLQLATATVGGYPFP